MSKTIASFVVITSLALGLQACGGDGDRPGTDDLSDSLADAGIESDAIDCVAEELVDSDLSDKQLTAVADDDNGSISDDEEQEIVVILTAAAAACGAS